MSTQGPANRHDALLVSLDELLHHVDPAPLVARRRRSRRLALTWSGVTALCLVYAGTGSGSLLNLLNTPDPAVTTYAAAPPAVDGGSGAGEVLRPLNAKVNKGPTVKKAPKAAPSRTTAARSTPTAAATRTPDSQPRQPAPATTEPVIGAFVPQPPGRANTPSPTPAPRPITPPAQPSPTPSTAAPAPAPTSPTPTTNPSPSPSPTR